ncbi:MAG: hypothetical protein E6188_06900 [Veillonella sp.]|nr:hypothetical protein [Veillonella sp.]
MGALLASPIISAVISIAVAYIAFKVAFFTIKRGEKRIHLLIGWLISSRVAMRRRRISCA